MHEFCNFCHLTDILFLEHCLGKAISLTRNYGKETRSPLKIFLRKLMQIFVHVEVHALQSSVARYVHAKRFFIAYINHCS